MKQRLLFIDRDGTLIEEPADEQIDSFDKLKFVEGAITNLAFIAKNLDFRLVMVSNQDGLGTDSFPEDTFWPVQNFIIQTLEGEGIVFDEVLIDRHFPADNHPNRKPGVGMLTMTLLAALSLATAKPTESWPKTSAVVRSFSPLRLPTTT